MRNLSQLLDVPSTDPDERRRSRLLNIMLLGVASLSLLTFLLAFAASIAGLEAQARLVALYWGSLSVFAGTLVLYLVNRRWPGWLPSLMFLLLLTVALAFIDEPQEVANGRSLFIFAVPILMASALLRPYASFFFAALSSLMIAIQGLRVDLVPNPFAMLTFFAIALVSWLFARGLERTLEDLRRTNLELDRRVDERTRDLAEALAREHSEANKNQAILEGIADGVIVFDDGGKAIIANPAVGRILALPADEIVGRDIGALMDERVSDADQEMVSGLLREQDSNHAGLKFDWGTKTLSVSFAPVRSTPGQVAGTVAVFRDFTREAEIDRMKSDFVSIVSHELRTPLTSIKGYLELVMLGAAGSINKQQASFLEIAKDNSERLHTLVSDLLDISRIESGKVELDVQVVQLPQIVEQVAIMLHKEFEDRDLSLTLDVSPDLPEVFGDPDRITQILINLLSNAYKYTKEGGATVRAGVVEEALRIDVVDTGFGISEEDQAMLFSRFFRAQDTAVRQQTGTGLGLNITKMLVELHGGEIWVESNPGVGSTFSFTLPLPAGLVSEEPGEEVKAVEKVPVRAKPPIPAGPWILIAEDEADVAELFKHQLEQAGYRVMVVSHGSRVARVARELKPELITLDLLMDVDGLAVLQELKADPATAGIPVVIVSVIAEAEKGLAMGAADYLVKPLDKGVLIDRIGQVLEPLSVDAPKILVVDDEMDIVGWLKHSLGHAGFQVVEAYDGLQALEAVAAEQPDLILLDMKMPRMDGRATIRRLREQADTREIPVIVLSANSVSDEAERDQMQQMGIQGFLRKPVTIKELVAQIQEQLGGT